MTKKEITDYINGLIRRAKDETAKGNNEKSLDEIIFEFYCTVAKHYENKIPQSIHKEFIKSTPGFKDFLTEKMNEYSTASINAELEVDSLEKEVKKASKKLSDLKAKQIKVVDDKKGKNAPDTDSLKSLIEMMNSGEDDKTPEKVNEAYFYLYKMHSAGNEICKSIHDMIMQAHPQLAETLRVFNNEEENEKLQESLDSLKFSLLDARMRKENTGSRIISVYDDSPRSYGSYSDYVWHGGRC